MGTTYQVFNPLTGTHTEYQTESEAKSAMAEICMELLRACKPTVCQAISNENGDSTWVALDMFANVQVIVN